MDDVFNASALGIGSSGAYVPILLDVMGNDKAGGAKTLYSLDDGTSAGGIRPTDLLTQDTARAEATSTDSSAGGARIWITADGKVGYDASTLSAAALLQLQSLGAGQYFTDKFTYAIRMANGTLSWATAEVRIAGVNDAASISGTSTGSVVEDTAGHLHAQGVLTVSDPDAGQSTFQTPTAASLNGTYGTFTFNALSGQWAYDLDHAKANHLADGVVEHDTLIVRSLDGTATKTITITVTGVNDAPVALDDTKSGLEDSLISGTVATNDSDVDDGETATLSYALDAPVAGLTLNADGSYSLDTTNAAYQHLAAGATTDAIASYTVTDAHGATDSGSLTITVTGVNDAPVAVDDVASTAEDTPLLNLNVLGNDTDLDGDTLSISGTPTALHGTVTVNPDGTLNYTPAANYNGPDTITYTVTDGTATDTGQVAVTVTAVNDAPVITSNGGGASATINVNENQTAVTTVAATDPELDPIAYSIVGGADQLLFDINPSTGALAFKTAPNFEAPTDNGANNIYNVTVQASDGHGGIDTQQLAIQVQNINEAPTGLDFVLSVNAGLADNGNNGLNSGVVLGTFVPTGDPDSNAFTYSLSNTTLGFAVDMNTGVLSTNATVPVPAPDTTPYTLTIDAFDGVNHFSTTLNIYVTGTGNDSIPGTSGIDIEFASNNDDTLVGQAGSDALIGGSQDDLLTGGTGNDYYIGGGGNDKFFFSAPAVNGQDTVHDLLQTSGDRIALLQGGGGWNAAGSAATALGANLAAADYVETRAGVVNITAADTNKVVELQSVQTTAQISTGIGGAANAYVLVFNTTTGRGELWYDSNWSDTAGRTQVASFTDIDFSTELTGLSSAKVSEWV